MKVLDLGNPKILNNYSQAIEVFPPSYLMDILKSFDMSSIAVKSMQEAFRAINEEFLLSITKSFNAINENIGQTFATQLAAVRLMDIFKNCYSPQLIINGEIEAEPIQAEEVLALPERLEVKTIKSLLQSRLGIKLLDNGNYIYKRRLVKNLSLKNKAGILLQLFLLNKPHFVTHEEIQKKFEIKSDELYAYTFSHILKHLKNVFRDNGYLIDIKCQRRQGYFLNDIKPLLIN